MTSNERGIGIVATIGHPVISDGAALRSVNVKPPRGAAF